MKMISGEQNDDFYLCHSIAGGKTPPLQGEGNGYIVKRSATM